MVHGAGLCDRQVSSSDSTNLHAYVLSAKRTKAIPTSLHAFQSLEDFCLSIRVSKECTAIALTVVLMLPGHRPKPIKLPVWRSSQDLKCFTNVEDEFYKRLSKCLGRCITLSCSNEGIVSLLCSSLFEPEVPYNNAAILIGKLSHQDCETEMDAMLSSFGCLNGAVPGGETSLPLFQCNVSYY